MSKDKCRNHLRETGQAYPKSGCEVCGSMFNGVVCRYPDPDTAIEMHSVSIEKDALDSILIRVKTDDGQDWLGFASGPTLAWRKSSPKPQSEG